MFVACVLIVIAIFSGTLLTFLFDRTAQLSPRLCMGACIGLAILAWAGFLFSLAFGLAAASLSLSVIVTVSPALLLVRADFRTMSANSVRSANQRVGAALRLRDRATIVSFVFYIAMAILLGLVFGRAAFEKSGGIYTGVMNNLGDLPLHLQVIASFSQGNNFPPQDPTFAGARFAYPFLCDLLTAMLVRAGADVISAMWLQNMALALSLTGVMHYWTWRLTRSRLAGLIAPLLVLFSGGLGWTWVLMELHNSEGGLLTLLSQISHDYSIGMSPLFRWGNSLTTLFVPQRSILFGMPLAIVIFIQWWNAISDRASETTSLGTPPVTSPTMAEKSSSRDARKSLISAGLIAGMLPLIHAHTFLVVMGVGACLALLFRSLWREWLWFFAAASALALPQVLWLSGSGTIQTESYLGWHVGWDHGDVNVLWFWFVNTGFFIAVLLAALLWRGTWFEVPRKLLLFYVPFLFCFILPNLVKVAPWVWDNIKVLFYWYIASVPLVAWLLARAWQQRRSWWRWAAAGLLASMMLSGMLDVLRVVEEASEYQEFDPQGIEMARYISQQTPPHAVVLHAPTYNTPVFLTGRRSLLGYEGWMWSRGLKYPQRSADIQSIYSGSPDAERLIRQYHIEYVLVGPAELAMGKVNESFWAQQHKVSESGPYRLYQSRVQERD
jgi:hypothetical protein